MERDERDEGESIRLIISTITGPFYVEVNPDLSKTTILRLKELIEEQENIPVENQVLIFGDVLANDVTLDTIEGFGLYSAELARLRQNARLELGQKPSIYDGYDYRLQLVIRYNDTEKEINITSNDASNPTKDGHFLFF